MSLTKKQEKRCKALKNDKHARLVEDNKNQRLVASYRKLKALEQLTYAQKKRLSELETILKEKGVHIMNKSKIIGSGGYQFIIIKWVW